MSTETIPEQMQTIVARLRDDAGLTKVYISQAPDDAMTGRQTVVRKINALGDPAFANLRETFDLEVMCYGRPRSTEQAVEADAEAALVSLLTWRESGAAVGLSFARTWSKTTLPPPPAPADRELVTVRVVVSCVSWPAYLTTPLS